MKAKGFLSILNLLKLRIFLLLFLDQNDKIKMYNSKIV